MKRTLAKTGMSLVIEGMMKVVLLDLLEFEMKMFVSSESGWRSLYEGENE